MKSRKLASAFAGLAMMWVVFVCVFWLTGTTTIWADDGGTAAAASEDDAEKADKADSASDSEEEKEKRRLEKIRKLREELKKLEKEMEQPKGERESAPAGTTPPIAPPDQVPIEGTPAPVMPVAPTAQSGAPGGMGPGSMLLPTEQGLMPPTAFGPQDGFQRGPMSGGQLSPLGLSPSAGGAPATGGMNLLAPPTANPQASAGAASMDPAFGRYASFAVPQAMGQLGPTGKPESVQAATKDKPFANYTPPRAISPYQNLYREPVSGVDNYNAYVKPIMEQQRLNVQTQYEVSKLQRTSQAQGRNLQMLDYRLNPYRRQLSQPTTQQGPSQFMNLQHFYPGFQRRR